MKNGKRLNEQEETSIETLDAYWFLAMLISGTAWLVLLFVSAQ